jgi:hypothetical protein
MMGSIQKPTTTNRILKMTIGSILAFAIVYFAVHEILLSLLPEDNLMVPLTSIEEKIPIPPRPGVKGIIITGPVIKDLVFQIDFKSSRVKKLYWKRIERIDPTADVKIRAKVLPNGNLQFNPVNDVFSPGHSYAGSEIAKVVQTWRFTPYKHGEIRFWFNFPSRGVKLTVDVHDLRRNPDIPEKYFVKNGLLFYVEGLKPSRVNQFGRVAIRE